MLAVLNGDFPHGCNTVIEFILAVAENVNRLLRQVVGLEHGPENYVGIK